VERPPALGNQLMRAARVTALSSVDAAAITAQLVSRLLRDKLETVPAESRFLSSIGPAGLRRHAMTVEIDQEQVDQALATYLRRFRRSTKRWSFCLYTFVFGAAIMSALAGVIPQFHVSGAKNWATGLGLTASLFTAINGLGRFESKWQASRMARARTEGLQVQVIARTPLIRVCGELEQIILDQSLEVIGARKSAGVEEGKPAT
jgi:hypothetical protein